MLIIKKPSLLINESLCRRNIRLMAAKALEIGVIFRPHFKTHQSALIGEWFREEGVKAITVSSVSMAMYFAQHGWKDITIAFPVNILEIEDINQLASEINLHLLLESVETALFLSGNLTLPCGFFIKIDTGYHRTGIEASNIGLIDRVLLAADAAKLSFEGFLSHSGQAYHASSREQLLQIQQAATEKLLWLKKRYLPEYPALLLSVGDTPSCSQLPLPAGIDEIRPGNFVFFDVMQMALGSCTAGDIAAALICPVVAVHSDRNEAVIYGGAVHLSKEQTLLPPYQQPVFGLVVKWHGTKWDINALLGKVSALSQEHGIIQLTEEGSKLQVGDLVAVLPVHSCLAADLLRKYYRPDGRAIETMNS